MCCFVVVVFCVLVSDVRVCVFACVVVVVFVLVLVSSSLGAVFLVLISAIVMLCAIVDVSLAELGAGGALYGTLQAPRNRMRPLWVGHPI